MARSFSKSSVNNYLAIDKGSLSYFLHERPALSIHAWIRFTAIADIDTGTFDNSIYHGCMGTGTTGVQFQIYKANVDGIDRVRLRLRGQNKAIGGSNLIAIHTTYMSPNVWYSVGGVLSYIGDSQRLYLDDSEVTENDGSNTDLYYKSGWPITLGSGLPGTVTDGSPTAIEFDGDSGLDSVNDSYTNYWLQFTSGTLNGQGTYVIDYIGASRTFKLGANGLTGAPANGDTFELFDVYDNDDVGRDAIGTMLTGSASAPSGTNLNFSGEIACLTAWNWDIGAAAFRRLASGEHPLDVADRGYLHWPLNGSGQVESEYNNRVQATLFGSVPATPDPPQLRPRFMRQRMNSDRRYWHSSSGDGENDPSFMPPLPLMFSGEVD